MNLRGHNLLLETAQRVLTHVHLNCTDTETANGEKSDILCDDKEIVKLGLLKYIFLYKKFPGVFIAIVVLIFLLGILVAYKEKIKEKFFEMQLERMLGQSSIGLPRWKHPIQERIEGVGFLIIVGKKTRPKKSNEPPLPLSL